MYYDKLQKWRFCRVNPIPFFFFFQEKKSIATLDTKRPANLRAALFGPFFLTVTPD